ncbi:multiple sugar ABC transporter [Gracilibacillus boraciitolerans JCM 21714]|uniref:Multiple sugar ABC transporter n=1 Tax=Gracilibacillus boraciitolerans JCM 21714 TaxID=1298598 RepID=W4VI84_9BACI|nr:ABC transporter substrate-binding protein [Gracilibacillus boraciitolerans]GAE93120.1 multiple sugar ABC transporter [Gracilibacillus boraciitolerans JCM 21714]
MRMKFFLTMFLLVVLMIIVTACNSNAESGNQTNTEEEAGENTETNEETEHLIVAFPNFYGEPQDLDKVEAELSKLAEEKINATVEIITLSISAYQQQMNLMLTSDEKLDLAVVLSEQFSPQVSRGQLHEIGDMLEEHGQGIIDAVGEDFLKATQIDAKQYAVPTVRDFAASYGFMMPKEYVEKYDIDVDQINTLEDMGEILRMIKAEEPDLYPLTSNSPGESIAYFLRFVDPLSDFNGGVLPNYDNDLEVVNYYEMPEYVEMLKTFRSWYEEDLILPDVATTQTTKNELLKEGKIVTYSQALKPGIEEQNSRDMDTEMVAIEIFDPVATTSNVASIMWSVPRNSKIPEKAVELLNLMYSDKEVYNLLTWGGIEGEHFEKVSDEVIKYPDGVTSENVGYSLNTSWLTGNQFLSYVFENEDPELWNQIEKFNNDSIKSKALGFNFNSAPVSTEIAAVSNVKEQYRIGLESGALDFDKYYSEFIESLNDAGMDKIIAEKQKQLDEWAKINGIK